SLSTERLRQESVLLAKSTVSLSPGRRNSRGTGMHQQIDYGQEFSSRIAGRVLSGKGRIASFHRFRGYQGIARTRHEPARPDGHDGPAQTGSPARQPRAGPHGERPGSLNPDAVKKEAEQIGQFGRDLLRQVTETA